MGIPCVYSPIYCRNTSTDPFKRPPVCFNVPRESRIPSPSNCSGAIIAITSPNTVGHRINTSTSVNVYSNVNTTTDHCGGIVSHILDTADRSAGLKNEGHCPQGVYIVPSPNDTNRMLPFPVEGNMKYGTAFYLPIKVLPFEVQE